MRRSRPTLSRLRPIGALLTVLLALAAAAPALAAAADRYVAQSGDDTANDCLTQGAPCLTVQHAVDVSDPDDIVNISAGTYDESVVVDRQVALIGPFGDGTDPESPSRGGAAEARIVGVGGDPAVSVDAFGFNMIGMSVGPTAGPAAGTGVQLAPGTDSMGMSYTIVENLARGIDGDGTVGTTAERSLFRDNTVAIRDAGESAVTRNNVFRRNTTAVDLDAAGNIQVLDNVSRDDGVFLRSRSVPGTTATGNDIGGVTDAGIVIAGGTFPDIERNAITGSGDGVRIGPDAADRVSNAVVSFNDLHDLGGDGLAVADGALDTQLQAHGNRIAATTGTGLKADGDSDVDAAYNWWGCNSGPDTTGCDDTGGTGSIDASLWTTMAIEAANPTSIPTGGATSDITVTFIVDNNGNPIPDQGIADGVGVDFSTTLGTMDPPTAGTSGSGSLTLLRSGDVPGTATVTATLDSESLTTDVTLQGSFARIAPAAGFDFGSVSLGASSALQKFTVKNTGNEDLVVSSVGIGGISSVDYAIPAAGDLCTGATLVPGAFCSVKVRFQPVSGPGSRPATLSVDSNAAGSPDSVPLTGTATPTAGLVISPSPFDYGDVALNTSSPAQKFTVKNVSPDPVHVTSAGTGAEAATFPVGANTCTGAVLAPGATCWVKVRFAPRGGPGARSGMLHVSSDAPSPALASLSGTATGASASMTVTPSSFAFGDVALGATSAAQKFTIKNVSFDTIHITSVGTGAEAAAFPVSASTCTNIAIPPGATCSVKVRFTPPAGGPAGARIGTLHVDGDAPIPVSASLSGTGTGDPVSLIVSPSAFSFGDVTVGMRSAAQKFTIKNVSDSTVHVDSVGTGAGAAEFPVSSDTCANVDLAPGAFCSVKVRFTPNGPAGGRVATLSVTGDAPNAASASLSGTAVDT
jgi:hypothetical protein